MVENSLLLNRANSAVISHDYALAARLYSTLLKENPDDKDLLARLGNVYIKSGEDEKALPVFQKIREKNSGDTEVLLTLGGIYRRIKKYDESVAVLNEALSSGAKRDQVYYNLGFTYKFMERYEDAIDCFETVVTLNPSDVLAYNHLGSIYESKGDHEAAISAYQKGLKIDQNHPVLHLNLANVYEHSGNVEGAIREYDAALRYKPGWNEAYAEYTSLLLKIGRVGDAQILGEQAISLNANDARLQTILGDIYMAESDYESAEKKYNDSIKISPDHAQTLKGLATSLERQGKNGKAIEAIQKARSISPNDGKLIKRSASINLSAQKLAEASKDIKELFDIDKNDVETLDLAGQYYICADDEERAKKVYRKIGRTNPEYKKHLFNASDRYKQKGNLSEAENYIVKYLSKKPDDSHGLVSLAMIEERLGKTEAALENYKKAFASDSTNHLAKKSSHRLSEIVSTKEAAVQEQIQEEAELAEQEDLPEEFDMGQEEAIVQEDVIAQDEAAAQEEVAEENILEEDDFDFESFGKSPLIDDEDSEEFDFEAAADDFEEFDQEQEDSVEDEDNFDAPDFAEDESAPDLKIPQEKKSEEKNPAPKLDVSDLAEKMAQMAANAQKTLDAAQLARQQEEARRLAEENARLRAQQEELAKRAAEEAEKKLAEEKAAAEEAARKLEEEKEAARKATEEAAKKLEEEKAAAEEAARKLEEEKEAARKAAEEAARKLAEEKAAAEEAARKLAAEKAALEEAAKELKEEKEAFRKTLEEALEDDEKDASEENFLKDEEGERDFESQIKLFRTLLALSESLPPKEKKEFLQSRERVTLEYLISTLEGEPGLLKTSSALRKSGVLADMVSEDVPRAECPADELLQTVLGDMKSLSQDLEEEDLSIALVKMADELLEKK